MNRMLDLRLLARDVCRFSALMLACCVIPAATGKLLAQDAETAGPVRTPVAAPASDAPKKDVPLDLEQQSLLGRFDRLDQEMLQMAEQLRRMDP